MPPSDANESENMKEAKLSRRDWILLPALSLLTIFLIAGSVELIARKTLTTSNTLGENCMFNDPATGPRGIPNCKCWEKIPESELTEYRFNSSGFRDNVDLQPKSPDTYRIVMMGTSVVAGFRVPEEKTFAALLPAELSQRTRRKIELYNEGMPFRTPHVISIEFNDVLLAKPDMILWIVNPTDIAAFKVAEPDDTKSLGFLGKVGHHIKVSLATNSLGPYIATAFSRSRTGILLSDILYESPSQYMKSSLSKSDSEVGFLKTEPSSEWRNLLEDFDSNAASIERQARGAGIPIVVAFVPSRMQLAMITMTSDWPKGTDPYKLGDELGTIIEKHGGTYIDILPDFRTTPNAHLGYFAVDVHPNAYGHALISKFLSRHLTDGAIPALQAAAPMHAGLDQNK
jgi:hypothetical protein